MSDGYPDKSHAAGPLWTGKPRSLSVCSTQYVLLNLILVLIPSKASPIRMNKDARYESSIRNGSGHVALRRRVETWKAVRPAKDKASSLRKPLTLNQTLMISGPQSSSPFIVIAPDQIELTRRH